MRRGIAALVVAGVLVGAMVWERGHRERGGAAPVVADDTPPPKRLIPEGTRVRVEVLNTTDVRGLGRRATIVLRDAGFDVVRYAGEGPSRDSTLILDRTGHPEWAEAAAEAVGGAVVEARPDSTRYVDLTILLGRNWRPPAKPFNP